SWCRCVATQWGSLLGKRVARCLRLSCRTRIVRWRHSPDPIHDVPAGLDPVSDYFSVALHTDEAVLVARALVETVRRRFHRAALLEEVLVHFDDLHGLLDLHADAVADHQRGHAGAVDQD